jgi:hypothetical protein
MANRLLLRTIRIVRNKPRDGQRVSCIAEGRRSRLAHALLSGYCTIQNEILQCGIYLIAALRYHVAQQRITLVAAAKIGAQHLFSFHDSADQETSHGSSARKRAVGQH